MAASSWIRDGAASPREMARSSKLDGQTAINRQDVAIDV